jgi:hypothetical protein
MIKDNDELKVYIDATDYFYVSKIVAKEFPDLYESKFIQVLPTLSLILYLIDTNNHITRIFHLILLSLN